MRRALTVAALLVAMLVLASLSYPAPEEAAPSAEPTEIITPAPPALTETRLGAIAAPEQTPEPLPSRYEGIEITDSDVETLARLVWHEARGESFDGQRAVVEVVLNRILSPSFPDTVEGVVFQKLGAYWQFSPAPILSTATPTEEQYEAVAAAIQGDEPITDADVVYFSVGAYNERIYATIGNHVFCRE